MKKLLLSLKIFLLLGLIIIGLNSYAKPLNYKLSTEVRPLTYQEKKLAIQAVKDFFHGMDKKQLDSMQFIFPDYNGNKYGGYCGLVNTENDKNQYMGYKPFILWFSINSQNKLYTTFGGTVDITIDTDPAMTNFYLSTCKNKEDLKYNLQPILDKENNSHAN